MNKQMQLDGSKGWAMQMCNKKQRYHEKVDGPWNVLGPHWFLNSLHQTAAPLGSAWRRDREQGGDREGRVLHQSKWYIPVHTTSDPAVRSSFPDSPWGEETAHKTILCKTMLPLLQMPAGWVKSFTYFFEVQRRDSTITFRNRGIFQIYTTVVRVNLHQFSSVITVGA